MVLKAEHKKLEGIGNVKVFHVFSGVTVSFLDLHAERCNDFLEVHPNVIEINHCRKGRFECEFLNGYCYYIGEGDLAVSMQSDIKKTECFPFWLYQGFNLLINLDHLDQIFLNLLDQFFINGQELVRRWRQILPCKVFKESREMAHIFEELYQVDECMDYGYLRIKILELLLCLEHFPLGEEKKYHRLEKKEIEKIHQIQEEMKRNLEEEITLEELAKKYKMSVTYLKHCFFIVYGVTPVRYRKEYRMQIASQLLKEGKTSIADVAIQVGYQNPSKFAAAFRSVMKKSPSQYKKSDDLELKEGK